MHSHANDRAARGLLATTLVALVGCSSVTFEAADPQARIWPISRKTRVSVVDRPGVLPQPVQQLGELRGAVTDKAVAQAEGVADLTARAWRYGCDALLAPHVQDVAGPPAGQRWVAGCLRSAAFPLRGQAPAPVASPAPPAEPPPPPTAETAPSAPSAEVKTATPAKGQEAEKAVKPGKSPPADPVRPSAAAAEAELKAKAEAAARAKAEAAAAEREQKIAAEELRKRKAAEAAQAKAEAAEAEKERKRAAEEERKAKAQEAAEAKAAAAAAEKAKKEAAEAERKQQAEAAAKAKAEAAEAERQRQAELAAAKKAKAEAEARAKAEAAETERQRQAAEAEAAARKKAAELEEAAKKKAAADQAAQAEAAAARAAAARQAVEDHNSAAQIDFLVQHPDAPESAGVFAELQVVAVAESANWISDVQCQPSKELAPRRLSPATLQADLANAKVTQWRSYVPKGLQCSFAVRNPSQNAVLVEVDLLGNRTARFLTARQAETVKQTVRCKPDAPTSAVQNGVLEYRYGCAATGPTRLAGVRPAAAELAVDKRAADPAAPLDVLAKVWQARPATRLGPAYAAAVSDRLHREQEDVGQVSGKATLLGKPSPDQNVPIRVEFSNLATRDVTVLYTAGTGRDERLSLPKAGRQELTVLGRPGQSYEVQVARILPKLRSVEWLWGNWVLGAARLVLLPDGKGGLVAFPLVADGSGMRRAVPTVVELAGGVAKWSAKLDAVWLGGLLPKLPASCTRECDAQFSARLSDQESYTVAGPRQLVLEVQVGDVKATVKWAED